MASVFEEIKVQSRELVDKVKGLLHEGNVRRIIVKDEKGHTFLEIPLTVAAIGVIGAPVLAGIGAIAATVAHFTVVWSAMIRNKRLNPNPFRIKRPEACIFVAEHATTPVFHSHFARDSGRCRLLEIRKGSRSGIAVQKGSAMLVLRRRAGEALLIGNDIEIEFLELSAQSVKVGIRAPQEVSVLRKELKIAKGLKELPQKNDF